MDKILKSNENLPVVVKNYLNYNSSNIKSTIENLIKESDLDDLDTIVESDENSLLFYTFIIIILLIILCILIISYLLIGDKTKHPFYYVLCICKSRRKRKKTIIDESLKLDSKSSTLYTKDDKDKKKLSFSNFFLKSKAPQIKINKIEHSKSDKSKKSKLEKSDKSEKSKLEKSDKSKKSKLEKSEKLERSKLEKLENSKSEKSKSEKSSQFKLLPDDLEINKDNRTLNKSKPIKFFDSKPGFKLISSGMTKTIDSSIVEIKSDVDTDFNKSFKMSKIQSQMESLLPQSRPTIKSNPDDSKSYQASKPFLISLKGKDLSLIGKKESINLKANKSNLSKESILSNRSKESYESKGSRESNFSNKSNT